MAFDGEKNAYSASLPDQLKKGCFTDRFEYSDNMGGRTRKYEVSCVQILCSMLNELFYWGLVVGEVSCYIDITLGLYILLVLILRYI